MSIDDIQSFAKTTCQFVNELIKSDVITNDFISWGGIRQCGERNRQCEAFANVTNWFKFCQDTSVTKEQLLSITKGIADNRMRSYFITRLIKTRVAFSDETFLALNGCQKNPNLRDKKWDNLVGGVQFDIKSTFVPTNRNNFGEFVELDNIMKDPLGLIGKYYKSGTSTKDGSERADVGFLNNRLYIINHSKVENRNKFLVECGCNGRFKALEDMAKNITEENIFDVRDAYNDSDESYYNVKSAVLVIVEEEPGVVNHYLLKKT